MPALLGCTSRSSDFDSLPRGQRGSSAAIHRLQASSNNNSRNEFGSSTNQSSTNNVTFDPSTSPTKQSKPNGRFRDRTRSTGTSASILDRNDSTNTTLNGIRHSIDGSRPSLVKKSKSTSSNHSSTSILGRRNSTLAQRAPPVSSTNYPLVSSDLDLDSNNERENPFKRNQNDGFGENGGRDSPIGFQRGSISAPSSPKKSSQSKLNGQSPRITSPVSGAARKRVISKDMIGLPTNFQHTGHIGASSYRTAVVDSAALQAQLSEVAAALNFDLDLGPVPSTVAPSSPSPALSSLPKGVPESIIEDEVVTQSSPQVETQPLVEEEEEPSIRATASSSSPSSIPQALPSLRATSPSPSNRSSMTTSSASRPLPNPPQQNQDPTSPSASISNQINRSESPFRTPSSRKPAPSTYGHSFTPSNGQMTPSSLSSATSPRSPLARQGSATSGVSGGGARKRKPVPRALELDPTIGSEDGTESFNPSEDIPLNVGLETDLQRNVSVVGELPSPGGFKGGKRTPLARANQLASAFSQEETKEEEEVDGGGDPTSKFNKGPNGTLRLGGKKMVEGPGGNYISDTANFRWNSAMKEITLALKDDDDQGGLEEGMRRADQLLGKLGDE